MKKYIFCYLLLGGFWIGGASVEGMELSTNEGTNLKKLVLISSEVIPPYSFKGKERIRFIPESKIKKIPAVGGIPSLKDLCLDFLASEIESWKNTPPEGKKERGLGQVGIISEEEDSKPGEEKAASSPSFLQRVDDQIETFLRNQPCALNENLKLSLKMRMCQKRRGIWKEWKNLSEEERNKQGCISFWREIGKEDFWHFYNVEWEENGGRFWGEPESEEFKKALGETGYFYSMVQKIKIHKIIGDGIFLESLDGPSLKRVKYFLENAENLESVYFEGNDLFESLEFGSLSSIFFETPPAEEAPIHLFDGYVHVMNENPSLNLKELILDGVFLVNDPTRWPNKIEESIINKVWKTLQEARSLQSLEILNLRGNYLGDTHIKELVLLLKDKKFLPCLRSLILECNCIKNETRKELWEALKERPCFQVLDLTRNSLFNKFRKRPAFSENILRRYEAALEIFSNQPLSDISSLQGLQIGSPAEDPLSDPSLLRRFKSVSFSNQPLSDISSLGGLQSGPTGEELWLREWGYLPLCVVSDRKPY